jgi:hypothetical protein
MIYGEELYEEEFCEEDFNCQFILEEGFCPIAGTDECEWACPYSDELFFGMEEENETPMQAMQEKQPDTNMHSDYPKPIH